MTNLVMQMQTRESYAWDLAEHLLPRPDEEDSSSPHATDRDRAWATATLAYAQRVLRSARVGFSIIDHTARFVLRVGEGGSGFFRANLESGVVIVLSGLNDSLTRRDRELLTRVAHYIETSYRLLNDEELAVGTVDLRGDDRVTDGAITLRALWAALISGHLTLIEQGQGRYVIVESSPHARALRALTRAEIEVVEHAARGFSTKMIAFELGFSSPKVSRCLFHAASKAGIRLRTDIVRLLVMSRREGTNTDAERPLAPARLTVAERDVLALVRRGLSNEEIARLRARSIHTVANQVASLLKKTSSSSRRALAATL